MSPWAKLDDNFHSHAKTLAAGLEANGFYCRALSYCAHYLTDGFVGESFVALHLPGKARDRVIARLLDTGLFTEVAGGYRIADFLDRNPSRAEVDSRRKRDRVRKDSTRNPDGVQEDLAGAGARASGRDGCKEVGRKENDCVARARELGLDAFLTHNQQVTGNTPPGGDTKMYREVAAAFVARSADYSLEDLKLANVGAQADDHRRDNGYTTADSVLRPTKVYGLIEKGRRAAKQNRPPGPAEADLRCRGCGEAIDVFRFRNRSRLCQGCEDREAEAA
jgi:hypothetical protein